MNELLPNTYNPRMLIERIYHNPQKALTDPALWLCAWCYRCYHRCPQKVKLPEVLLSVRKIAKEQGSLEGYKRALELISQEIPFPASFGYICLHPERVELKPPTDNADKQVASKRKTKKTAVQAETPNAQVAVIGAGPAGLTAAHELVKRGYIVTVFESSSRPGGMLRHGIPEFRLPKKLLDAEIEHIKNMGVQIRTNVKIGKDLTFEDLLKQGFKAVFVSVGAHRTRKLRVEGEDLKGVFDALDFLGRVNCGEKANMGEHVAVIGGGNVAIDSARTAVRLGAKEVSIFYRRSRDEMPANPYEVKEAENEGIKIQFLITPKRILGESERVHSLECVKMALGEPDETGRRAPMPIEGSEFTVPVDSVILAIGEAPDVSFLPKEIEINEDNTITVEPFTVETSTPGVFAGGDCVSGPATVIEAILAGKKAADRIEHYLKSQNELKPEQVLEGGTKA